VPGRPVENVCLVPEASVDSQLRDGNTSGDFASVVLDISRSSVHVTTLRIQYFMPTLSRLTTIANHLPDLHLLDLNLISVSQLSLVTHLQFIFASVSLSPQEDLTTPSDASFDTYLDHHGDPLGRVDTIHVCRITTQTHFLNDTFSSTFSVGWRPVLPHFRPDWRHFAQPIIRSTIYVACCCPSNA
jgi:hypothetical protein